MSISDRIVVMREGVLMQQGVPQQVYDDPANLFVAKFLGTPPINVFAASVRGERLFLGESPVLEVPGAADQEVWAGIRPEGLVPQADGPMACQLHRVEAMGRDVSIVCRHPACQADTLRAMIGSVHQVDPASAEVRFALRPEKVFLFNKEDETRIPFAAARKGEDGAQ